MLEKMPALFIWTCTRVYLLCNNLWPEV